MSNSRAVHDVTLGKASHWALAAEGRPAVQSGAPMALAAPELYLVPLPLHLLQLQHDGVHAVLVHFAVLPQRRALQLQVFLLFQVLQVTGRNQCTLGNPQVRAGSWSAAVLSCRLASQSGPVLPTGLSS